MLVTDLPLSSTSSWCKQSNTARLQLPQKEEDAGVVRRCRRYLRMSGRPEQSAFALGRHGISEFDCRSQTENHVVGVAGHASRLGDVLNIRPQPTGHMQVTRVRRAPFFAIGAGIDVRARSPRASAWSTLYSANRTSGPVAN
jgi:hypothetical protein